MIFNTFFIAISSTIDSLGIGITYGLRKIKLSHVDKIILFFISIFVNIFSGFVGYILKSNFSTNICEYIGSALLLCMGIFIIIQSNNKEFSFDFDKSKDISHNEALLLGFALSLDSLCIGIGASTIGINIFIFALLVAVFQYIFLALGNFLGINLSYFNKIPQDTWSKISGIILILIGLFKF